MSVGMSCPFCGSHDQEIESMEDEEVELHFSVYCGSCGCIGPVAGTASEASAMWNDRYGGD